jgi:hypothetical protein
MCRKRGAQNHARNEREGKPEGSKNTRIAIKSASVGAGLRPARSFAVAFVVAVVAAGPAKRDRAAVDSILSLNSIPRNLSLQTRIP